jgi:hypothetical protein
MLPMQVGSRAAFRARCCFRLQAIATTRISPLSALRAKW